MFSAWESLNQYPLVGGTGAFWLSNSATMHISDKQLTDLLYFRSGEFVTRHKRPDITVERVRQTLIEANGPLTRRELSSQFGLSKQQSDEYLRPVLGELIASGEVIKNRRAAYGVSKAMNLIKGRISAHPDGFGFVVPDQGGQDLFLSPKQMRQVMDGDEVMASVAHVDRRGRLEGAVVEVVRRAHEQVVGRLMVESGIASVVPDNPKLTQDVIIPINDVGGATPGQIVVARIVQPPTLNRSAVGTVVTVLGQADEPGIATEIAIHSYELPAEFSTEVIKQAAAFGEVIDAEIASKRRDLRSIALVTIDGADARDFDDAVYAEPTQDGGFRVLVCIADVAEYVTTHSAIDKEAIERGTSVYFPDRVLPMLPESLSNGLCSLVPEQDRLCVTCDMRLDAQGKVVSSRFYEAVMRSHARLTYDQVQRILVAGDEVLAERFAHVRHNLDSLMTVYRSLAARRERRGALDFESDQVYFEFAADGHVSGIRRHARHDAHKLIEELMIAANVEAARFVDKHHLPMLFRVHEPPQEQKLEALEAFLKSEGIKLRWTDVPDPAQFAALQRKVAGTPLEHLINAVLLRSLSLAVYSPDNAGHFGLALSQYAHFTSPIRRYPDLLLHRAIKHICRKTPQEKFPISADRMVEFGRRCSWTERRAEEASRDVDERLKCQFMQRHLGEVFSGVITGVTGFGVFVELVDLGVSGLVHITSLPQDYYDFDPDGHQLIGKRSKRTFRLASRVQVKVAGVSVAERKIDFEWVADET